MALLIGCLKMYEICLMTVHMQQNVLFVCPSLPSAASQNQVLAL